MYAYKVRGFNLFQGNLISVSQFVNKGTGLNVVFNGNSSSGELDLSE